MEKALWKPVKDYEGLYEISNTGLVKSLSKTWITGKGNGRIHTTSEMILKPSISKFGYARVALSKNGKFKKFQLHRLVAFAFCDGYFENSQVNHKDGNKLNNRFENLEFVTASENIQHAFDSGLKITTEKTKNAVSKRHSGSKNVNAKKVINTETGKVYDTIKQAANENNLGVWCLYAKLRGINKNNTNLKYA